MRVLSCLAMLLLTVPAHALPTGPVTIHLTGDPTQEGVVLRWEVHGDDLTSLDLVRVRATGALDVIPLDPATRVYVDAEVGASTNQTYFLVAEFDGGVTASNAYDARCPYVRYERDPPDVHLQPECIPESQNTLGW